MTTLPETIIQTIQDAPTDHVKVAVSDIDGILRGKYLQKAKLLQSLQSGLGFCSVIFGWDAQDACYDGSISLTGLHTGYPDFTAYVDLSTFRQIPWDNHIPFFLADFSLPICPRQLLKKIIAKAEKMGIKAYFGAEYEWFNFQETSQSLQEKHFANPSPLTPGMFGYSIVRQARNHPFFEAMLRDLPAFKIPIEGLHTETGPGVFEAAILYSDALEAADRAILFKSSVKEIALRFGIMPSFMAKWSEKLPGCSGHLHQSLWDKDQKTNLFFDDKDPYKMSETFRQYIAGQMALLPEFLVLFAPTVNSYKRLVEGYWAPTKVTWGIDNRTTALRVIPGSTKSTRLETRVPGSDMNAYLAIAAALGAGLYGIEKQLSLQEKPLSGNAYEDKKATVLPRNLLEAALLFKNSQAARSLLGDAFVDHYAATRIWEWKQYQKVVTSYERERYFEII